jgi:capsular polysaccharide biosynthesis protein
MPVLEKMNDRFRWDYLAGPPDRFARVIAEMNRRVDREAVPSIGHERVYLARRPWLHRKLLNCEEIEAAARDNGFEVVYPKDLDLRAQVGLLRGARYVVGPEGSAMFLAFFSRPGTRLCILNHQYTVHLPVLTRLLEAIGVDVTVVTGPDVLHVPAWPHFADYDIDPATFDELLRGWSAATT